MSKGTATSGAGLHGMSLLTHCQRKAEGGLVEPMFVNEHRRQLGQSTDASEGPGDGENLATDEAARRIGCGPRGTERQRVTVSAPLTGRPHTVPAYVTFAVDTPVGVAVPVSVNGHTLATPVVDHAIVSPFAVPDPEPLIDTPEQVAA